MKKESGAALIVVLSLLTISLMVGLSSMQSSQIDERLAGNYKAASQAQMNAEQAASVGAKAALANSDYWSPSNANVLRLTLDGVDEGFGVKSLAMSTEGFKKEYSDYIVEIDSSGAGSAKICDGSDGCFYVPVILDFGPYEERYVVGKGYVGDFSIADSTGSVIADSEPVFVRIGSYAGVPDIKGTFTCFEDGCSSSAGGSAELVGQDSLPPNYFSCNGVGGGSKTCESGDNDSFSYVGVSKPPYAYPASNVSPNYFPHNSAESDDDMFLADLEKAAWKEYVRSLVTTNDIVSVVEGNFPSSPGRFPPQIISVEGSVQRASNENTSGIILVRSGASYTMKGNGHHEGLIIVEEGGSIGFSSGTPRVYGAVIELESNGDVAGKDLDLSGNIAVRYSSYAIRKIDEYYSNSGAGYGGQGILSWR